MSCADDAEGKDSSFCFHLGRVNLTSDNSYFAGEVIGGGLDNNCPHCHPSCSYMTIKKEVTSTPLVRRKGFSRLVGICFFHSLLHK
jgi:hypothetical protein